MLSDSTPGRDTVELLPLKRSLLLMDVSLTEKGEILEQQRFDDQPRLEWMAEQRARLELFRYYGSLLQQRALLGHPLQPRLVVEALLFEYLALFGTGDVH